MKILTFTSLYPNAAQPNHAVFVENRLRHLVEAGKVDACVVAPVPWFPFGGAMFGRYGAFARVPRRERRFGIDIVHPRYPVVPKIGMTLAPLLMYAWTKPAVARLLKAGYDFDLIDAHYFYPDGVAAVFLGQSLGKPVTITARGSDINFIPRHTLPRGMIRWAAERANALIAVSRALKQTMVQLGMDPAHIHVLRNGVDLEMFRPGNREAARRKLDLRAPLLLSVGNLIPLKGHDRIIRALTQIPGATLAIVGVGPDESALKRLARDLGLGERVRFLGMVPHADMPEIYGAADVLILASAREGWPNVLLEAMACGTPAVATNVSGIPEVIAAPAAGRLLHAREPEVIAQEVRDLLADPPDCAATRAYAERFSWEETIQGQIRLFREILGHSQAGESAAARPA